MSFAAFLIKLDAKADGVATGVNAAINHYRRLADTVQKIERTSRDFNRQLKEENFKRLNVEEKINSLLKTREQILQRLKVAESGNARAGYLQRQTEVEQQLRILGAQRGPAITSSVATGALGGLLARGRAGLSSGLRAIPGVGGMLSRFGWLGAAGPGVGIAGLASSGFSDANALQDQSAVSGISVGALQRIRFGAGAAGGNPQDFMASLGDLRGNQSKALAGNEKQIRNFERLGFTIKELRALQPEDLFFKLARAAEQGAINTANFASFVGVLGDNAERLLPAMQQGFASKAAGFGGVIPNASIAANAEVKGSFQEAAAGVKAFAIGVASVAATLFAIGGKRLASGMAVAEHLVTGSAFSMDAAEQLKAEQQLIGDKDYSDSLGHTARLQALLGQSQGVRALQESEANEAAAKRKEDAVKEAKRYFQQYELRQAKLSGKKFNDRSSSGGDTMDVDKLASIGLYTDGITQQYEFQREQIDQLKEAVSELKGIRTNTEEMAA